MTYDLIIIGAGPGGYELAAEAARHGLSVLLAEKNLPGGTCLNRGCIPTKALCRNAQLMSDLREAHNFGIETGEVRFDLAAAIARKDAVVAQLREGVTTLLSAPLITTVYGEAIITSPRSVSVAGEQYTASNIVIATGSAPRDLPIEGANLAISSDDLLQLTQLPQRLCIIGGGVIGMEFAHIFHNFGSEVTVVEYCKEILPPFDKDIAKRLRQTLTRKGINFATGAAVTALKRDGELIAVCYDQKGKSLQVSADTVLMAVGRKPVIPQGAQELGIAIERGAIVVDDNMMTSVPGVYAIGDVNARCMLAHAATAQASVVINHITGGDSHTRLDVVPSAVFTTPELAMVGATEEQCQARELNFTAKKAFFRSNGKAVAMGEPDGLVKMIVDNDSHRILGCHICGAHAADLIQEVAIAIDADLTVFNIARAIHGHPTLSEVIADVARQFSPIKT